jgi:hypothetical protein
MTENATEPQAERRGRSGLCIVGGSTDSPCPFPASVALPHMLPEGAELCAYHAATQTLWEESDELNVSLELVREYLDGARDYPGAAPLIEALERAEADFTARLAHVGNVIKDLRAAEHRLMRGQPN